MLPAARAPIPPGGRRRIVLALSMLFKVRGGIQRFNQMLCLALDELAPELGIEGTVLSLLDSGEDYERAGAPWRRLEFAPCRGKLAMAGTLLASCAARRTDGVVIGLLGMTPIALPAVPLTRSGFAFIVHGYEAWNAIRPSRAFAARRARMVLSVSDYTAQALCRSAGVDPSRIRILPNTLDPGFEADARGAPVPTQGLELLSVSRLWPEETYKGIDVTIRAVAGLARRHPGIRYRIVGKGADRPRLEELARTLGVAERVIFEQDLEDGELAARYRDCSVFVLPSGGEGFGIVFLEAMRFGRPCVGGLPGGSAEVIAEGETGFLVPWGDSAALEDRLDRLLADPELRRRQGEAGVARLEDRFTFPRFRATVERHVRGWLGIP